MKLSIDQTTDYSNRELYAFLKDTKIPDFVKVAEVDDFAAVAGLSNNSFADNCHRYFPIHTPASVYISNAFFLNKKAALRRLWGENYVAGVESSIKKAAELFDIELPVEEYRAELFQKEAGDYEKKFIFTTKLGEDEVCLFPVATKEDLVKAAQDFTTGIEKIPFDWRRTIANEFVKQAAHFNVDELPDLICKYAGMFYPNIVEVYNELKYRKTKVADERYKDYYDKLAADVENVTTTDEIFKLAEAVYFMEKMSGLYDGPKKSILRDPVDAFFSLNIDKVAEMLNVVEMAGNRYRLDDLQKVPESMYKEAFGEGIDPKSEESLRDILPTMPLSDVSLFTEISGIKPVA